MSESKGGAGFSQAALLAEYTGLRIDQTQRFLLREIAFYLSLFANVTIVTIYELQSHDPRFLLLIPFASLILFWAYAANESDIRQIKRYIANEIAPKLAGNALPNNALLGWDELRRGWLLPRLFSNILNFAVLWVTFSGVSLAVLIFNFPLNIGHDALWLGAAAAAALFYLLWFWFIVL